MGSGWVDLGSCPPRSPVRSGVPDSGIRIPQITVSLRVGVLNGPRSVGFSCSGVGWVV